MTPQEVKSHFPRMFTMSCRAFETDPVLFVTLCDTGVYGKKGVLDENKKSTVLEHAHLPTSRLLNVSGKRRRRDVSRENRQ